MARTRLAGVATLTLAGIAPVLDARCRGLGADTRVTTAGRLTGGQNEELS